MNATVTLAGYAAVVVCAICLEVAARRWGRLATFAEALDVALRRPAFRLLLQAVWLWAGWHLFVRVHWR